MNLPITVIPLEPGVGGEFSTQYTDRLKNKNHGYNKIINRVE